MRIAVVAHKRKTLGGGLAELRERLAEQLPGEPIWHEVSKSRKAPKKVRRAVEEGAELVLVWGGDGMVQRCADALAGSGIPIGILPAGTANLLAANLRIPRDLAESLRIALHGARRPLDLGRIKGEHFAVMAGAGFDADMIAEADRDLKDRAGRLAYLWTGLRHVRDKPVEVRITVDGETWFAGPATCVLLGNVSTITGGIRVFDRAQPDDGLLQVGVTTAEGAIEWARTMARMALDRSERSPFVQITQGRRIAIRFSEPTVYELDGGARTAVKRLKAKVVPGAVEVCVPIT
ncbi:YegS/Rv2252/BmrU family lipid kinase [Allocatelliglobosispora scoriae]|uniref:YegS/Rv2252/BmrU family lipid kinase n=1 Tax=Allocatelliglobosispora scoriae TaxID=643052 RepID=A0A841BKH4_9ACTN|nr:diacylglycerol kinase family protein [Allocatelliglobosispora scoriae]MBB5867503.1 YegS/Rv2252/BmrU family lipid kinase [Allocatelliglobosispora scoriae]